MGEPTAGPNQLSSSDSNDDDTVDDDTTDGHVAAAMVYEGTLLLVKSLLVFTSHIYM